MTWMYFNLWHLLFSKRWRGLFFCQLFGWSSSSFTQDMTWQISTSQRSQYPNHSVLILEISVNEWLSWHASDLHRSFPYLPWDVSDHRSIRSPTCHAHDQDNSVLFPWDVSDHRSIRSPTCHAHDQDNSVLFPWDVSDLNQSDAFHNMPVIYRSFRFLPWDVIDQRSIRALTWHASDQDHSVPEMSVIECHSWHASDLQIFPFPSLRYQWSPINQISYLTF